MIKQWNELTAEWKRVLSDTFFQGSQIPDEEALKQLFKTNVLRLVGPQAPYPNMQFELTDLSGLQHFMDLEILVVTHHQIRSLLPLADKKKLKSLFLFNNQIESLNGIEDLTSLEQLYVQSNQLQRIDEVKNLTQLKEFYVSNNRLTDLTGITEEHSNQLTGFFCLPNDLLKQKEIIRVERECGVRCLRH